MIRFSMLNANVPNLLHERMAILQVFTEYIRRTSTMAHLGNTARLLLDNHEQCTEIARDLSKLNMQSIYSQFSVVSNGIFTFQQVQMFIHEFVTFLQ